MKAASHVLQMIEASVDSVNSYLTRLTEQKRDVINLGQAIPSFGPPSDGLDKMLASFSDPQLHRYTPDAGLPELRTEIARYLATTFDSRVGGMEQVVVTGGGNHAFLIACAVVINPGDAIGLLSPYFLNHRMIVEGCSGRAIEILPSSDFNYDREEIERAVEKYDLKAIVVVSPSNPTGKVFTGEEMQMLNEVCIDRNLWLISDEVYGEFVYHDASIVSAASLPEAGKRTLLIGSFSKAFGMTGWRVGWLQVPEELTAHALKVQNYSLICAPHPAQRLALHLLTDHARYPSTFLVEFARRRSVLEGPLRQCGLFEAYVGSGAYFAWFRPQQPIDSSKVVFDLMEKAGVCLMPGAFFGDAWSGWLRASYGNQSLHAVEIAAERIIEYFSS